MTATALTPQQIEVAQLTSRLKAGERLTDAQMQTVEAYRATHTGTAGDGEILLRLLAEADALHLPVRGPKDNAYKLVFAERRADYRLKGLPYHSRKTSDATRKEAERRLRVLEQAGRLHLTRQGGRVLWVRLTDAEDERQRYRICLPGIAETLAKLRRIQALIARGDCADANLKIWVKETDLSGVGYGSPGFSDATVELEESLLPALVRGWVISDSNMDGHAWYSLTAAGARAITSATPLTLDPYDLGAVAENDFYINSIKVALEELKTADPWHTNAVVGGLGCGLETRREISAGNSSGSKNKPQTPATPGKGNAV